MWWICFPIMISPLSQAFGVLILSMRSKVNSLNLFVNSCVNHFVWKTLLFSCDICLTGKGMKYMLIALNTF